MPSFSFPNMLPNMMAANMMGLGLGGINLLQQQQQQFQSQLQQQSNQPQRKSLFAPYLPQASLPPLLAAGKLVVGILRVNKRNRSDAYVATEVLDADIYICGSKDRNRALEGDIVAVELLDVDEVWGTKKEKEEKKRKKEENAAYDLKSGAGRKDDKKKDDVEVEGQGLMLFEDEEYVDFVQFLPFINGSAKGHRRCKTTVRGTRGCRRRTHAWPTLFGDLRASASILCSYEREARGRATRERRRSRR